jgi:hypothetical protein
MKARLQGVGMMAGRHKKIINKTKPAFGNEETRFAFRTGNWLVGGEQNLFLRTEGIKSKLFYFPKFSLTQVNTMYDSAFSPSAP